jgi:hypothetical protein
LPADWAAKVGEQLHAAMFKDAGQASFATDKLPGNIDYVGLIRLFLPRAKFIYTHRTPQDCALSNFEQMFASSVRFSFDLKALAHKYAWHEDIARYWIEDCGLDVYDLDYEVLVNDPEPNIRKLLDFCGLPFEENCLYPNEVKREIRTASVFQVRQPISAKSVGRWKRYEAQMQPSPMNWNASAPSSPTANAGNDPHELRSKPVHDVHGTRFSGPFRGCKRQVVSRRWSICFPMTGRLS